MKTKRTILLILIIALFSLIFYFSNQPAYESSNTSGGFIKFILEINPFTKNLENTQKIELEENMQHIVRKGAHFSIYTLVGILLMLYMNTYNIENNKKALVTFVFGVLYAIIDEVHQYFVPGRSCEFRDVCIDGSGVVLGVLIILLLVSIFKRKGAKSFE